ncbi:transposase [Acidithrix sp. C25]|jgi:transposase|uniref:transposase n=1 Tax=Acidithrix sp. C25 TaxID=1671482 RepID=UPI00191BA2FC|nr:transposase [Acidithrix sp. C25]
MPVGLHTDPAIKAEIVKKIRDEGMRVTDAASTYGVHYKTIYGWLKDGVVNGNSSLVLQVNRLKKENEQLYNLLGRATAELKRPKG